MQWLKPVLAVALGFAASAAIAQPANDNFANAFILTGNFGITNGNNTNATLQACETNALNVDNVGVENVTNSVWFAWTAPTNGSLELDNDNTNLSVPNNDYVLAVWTDTSGTPTLCDGTITNILADDDSQSDTNLNLYSKVLIPVVAGTTYYIEMATWDDGTPGDNVGAYELNWNFVPPALNDDFDNATVINGTSGTTNGNNFNATLESGEPTSIITDDNSFGVSVAASVWYVWTAPANGNVTFNTIGSTFDTILAGFTGNSVANLTLLSANDDISTTNLQSQISFYAVANTTYFIGVYGFAGPPAAEGNVVLNWNQQTPGFSAGQFRFTSTSYTASQRESIPAQGGTGMSATPGARISVTRVGGAAGKVEVAYTITNVMVPQLEDLQVYGGQILTFITDSNLNILSLTNTAVTNILEYPVATFFNTNVCPIFETNLTAITFGSSPPLSYTNFGSPFLTGMLTNGTSVVTNSDGTITFASTNNVFASITLFTNYFQGALPFNSKKPNAPWDYVAKSGVLTFNDYEMTKDIFVTLGSNNLAGNIPAFYPQAPVEVQVNLNSVTLDTNELQTIPVPTLDPNKSSTVINVYSIWQIGNFGANGLCAGLSSIVGTNTINFERSTLQVSREAGNANIAVYRGYIGGGLYSDSDYSQSSTVYYSIDALNAFDDWNTFNLQSGSDYAIPDIATKNAPEGVVDFASPSWGVLNFPAASGTPSRVQYITIPINNNNTVEFNKDIHIEFDTDSAHLWQNAIAGEVAECWVTILYDKQPAGAVDRTYNVDNSLGSSPPNNANPGANGPVYAVAVQPTDGSGVIAGDFSSYDATNATRIARATPTGAPDAGFIANTGLGADGFIDALAIDAAGGIFIGGAFDAFNGVQRNGIARLNIDGTLDNSVFLPGFGANNILSSIVIQPNGQILIAGSFTTYNTNNLNYIARLNPDGSVDPTFNPGAGPNDDIIPSQTSINSMALQPDGRIVIGGDFTSVDGISRNYIARLNADGSLDTTFDPGEGANDVVNAVAVDANNLILVGGAFTQLGTLGGSEGIERLNPDGSVDTTFGDGSGTSDIVNTITLQPDGRILLGGIFTSVNQTRRVSIARLLTDGTLDTSFMDTAYNQFAGLINPYYSVDINAANPVYSMALQADTNILIGGSFTQVGGGFSRGDIRPRSNVARLIGGATPGPGNIAMAYSAYSAAGQLTNSSASITINRINGTLGPALATIEPVTLAAGPGAAAYGVDFLFAPTTVTYGTTWSGTWMLSDGVAGANYNTSVTILANNDANTTLNLQLTQPVGSDIFFLGGANVATSAGLLSSTYTEQDGENIPLGVALGQSLSPLNILRNNLHPGVLSFSSPLYYTNENAVDAFINVVRTGGSDGNVTVKYKTVNGTALAGTDYSSATGTLSFSAGKTNAVIIVPIINGTVAQADRYLYVQLYTPGGTAGSVPTLGVTNAQLVIVNDNTPGGNVGFANGIPVVFGTTNLMTYGTNENLGAAQITVTRQGGSTGQLKVWVASSDGTARNGVNYLGFTNQLVWASGVSGPQTISVPVIQDFVVTSNLTVNLRLFSAAVNGVTNALYLGGIYTNALLTITNVDNPGTLAFNLSSYSFNDDGGAAIIPVVRSGGTAGTITAKLITYDGTAQTGINYYGTNTTITFTNGQMSESFRLPIINPMAMGPNLAFSVVLTNASPTNALGTPHVATVNIINSETYNQPPGIIDPTYNPTAGFDGPVFALALEPSDGKLLVGGSFTQANGVGRRRIARMNTDGTLDSKFSSYLDTQGASDTVRSVLVQTDGRVLVGGLFTNFNGSTFNHIARLNYDGSLDSSFSPGVGADNSVYAMAEAFINGSRVLYIGGTFATVGGVGRNAIARLSNTGALDGGFNPAGGPNGTVYALAVQTDGKVVIGGDFTEVNGVTNCNHIARLNTDGSVDLTFNPGSGTDNSVHSLAVQLDGKIVIGGLFGFVNGQAYNHIARLNTDGSVDTSFNPAPGANGDVQTISLQTDTRILIGGIFTKCNGVTRNFLTRLNPDGTVDTTINFGIGADNFVAASVIQTDNKIIIGGGFLNYDGSPHAYLARIFGGSMSGSGAIQFLSANYQVQETATNAIITVIRTGGTAGPNANGTGDIYVSYSTSPGTAVDPTNYTDVSGLLDFPAGEVLETFVVPVNHDGVVTPNLTVNLALSNPTSPAQLGNQPTAVLTIINDDSTISLSSGLYSVPKNVINGEAPINVIRNGGTNSTATVTFNTVPGGTANNGSDYTAVNQTVTFNPGVTDVVVDIPILDNPSPEGPLTVLIQLTNVFGSSLIAPTNATLTIVDTVNSSGQLSFASPTYTVTEGGGVGYTDVYVTVQRTLGSLGTLSVDYSTMDGTATSPAKYSSTNGVLNFTDGETSKTFFVQIRNTLTAEGPETFTINLSTNASTGASPLASPTNTVVTILNTNTGIAFASGANSFTEPSGLADGTLLLNVIRFNNTNGTTTVNYSTTNGTAISPINFIGVTNGTLTFNPGDTTKSIAITTVHDPLVTGDLFFTVGLANPSAGAQLTTPSYTVVTDHDADAGIFLLTNATSVYRNSGTVRVFVFCSNTNVEPVSVTYSTGGGSAVPGTDYTATSGTLNFTNGAFVNVISVPILLNNSVQSNRTFNVTLNSATPPGVLLPPTTETVTIVGTNTPSGLSFSTPIIISGFWGVTNADNTFSAPETGDPSIAGFAPNAPVWFEWTAPPGGNGEVTLDTIGSQTATGVKLDTVMAVFTGANLGNLNQLAANDDLYPNINYGNNQSVSQENEDAQDIFNTNASIISISGYTIVNNQIVLTYTTNNVGDYNYGTYDFIEPFTGPSGLRFNATAGNTYYIAVDTKANSGYIISNGIVVLGANGRGPLQLNWAFHPAGVFRFATEDVDETGNVQTNGNPLLLYKCAETEGSGNGLLGEINSTHGEEGPFNVNEYDTLFHAYYNYDVQGLLVTVTRVAGSSGRVSVDYTTVDGNTNIIKNGDIPAVAGTDYSPVQGTLTFNDFEMSKTIVIPIIDRNSFDVGSLGGPGGGAPLQNRDFMVDLFNPQRDPSESAIVSEPRVDPIFGQVQCRILSTSIDPKGPSTLSIVTTNISFGGTLTNIFTNTVIADQFGNLLQPTNALFNFSKSNYRFVRDAAAYWGTTPMTVYVNRRGTNNASVTLHYRFDTYFLDQYGPDDENNEFPLQPGSDYATPTPPNIAGIKGVNSDFAGVGGDSGTITFPGGKVNPYQSQPIHFNIQTNNLTEFNKDLHISLYEVDANNNSQPDGMVAECTATILFDDTVPPAGSVDELYNPDFASDLAFDIDEPNQNSTVPNPGTDPLGAVYAVLLNTNNQSFIGGAFSTYTDGTNTYKVNGIARLNFDGSLDPTFNMVNGAIGSGISVVPAGEFIRSMAMVVSNNAATGIVIGGNFTSYNNTRRNGVARLNLDGTVDTSFNPGAGANGTVWSVLAQTDGKVLIGGDFTKYNGASAAHVARLNPDGSLDNTFNPTNLITGPVYAMALSPLTPLNFTHSFIGFANEDDQVINLGLQTSGTLFVNYDMPNTNIIEVYYGSANGAAGTGTLLFAATNFTGFASVPFAPAAGLITNIITVVVNPGGSVNLPPSFWSYNISMPGNTNVVIGGNFTTTGQYFENIARLKPDGSLDTTFNPGTGPNGSVLSLGWQFNSQILVGGSFNSVSGTPFNNLTRLNSDGSIDGTFFNNVGSDNSVDSITVQAVTNLIYIGGPFTEVNGTHRLGFARLNTDGTVDTTFLDMAYNQYAGLPRLLYADPPGAVYSSVVQNDGNVIIGGTFQEVGGGQADKNVRADLEMEEGLVPSTTNLDLLVSEGDSALEPKTRDGVRNRSNLARLIGGATTGPGNIGMVANSYAVNKTQVSESVTLVRANGSIGFALANFAVLPGLAQSGTDYKYNSLPPLYPISWEFSGPTRMHSDGQFGANGLLQDIYGELFKYGVTGPAAVNVTILNNTASAGDVNGQFQMANPSQQDLFYLGGQDIPLGVGLGISQAPLTLLDNTHEDGVFGFSAPNYIATNSPLLVGISRTNGSFGSVQLSYQTTTNGSTAVANTDYLPANGVVSFASSQTSGSFPVTILNDSSVSAQEKDVNVQLYNIQDTSGGSAQLGLTNAVIRIINPNFPGFVGFNTNAYFGTLSSGVLNFTVARTVGSKGTVTLQYGTMDFSPGPLDAVNGVDYIGATNTLTWNNGDTSPRTVSIPLLGTNNVGSGNKRFGASLFNATLNGVSAPSVLGSINNATLEILNLNNNGTIQFSSPSYQFNENGGYATITVKRTGSTVGQVQVTCATMDGTALAGTNYVAASTNLTFNQGDITKNFYVPLLDDHKTNPPVANFYFGVGLTILTQNAIPGSPTNSVVHIVDAESYNQPPGTADPSFGASLNGNVLSLALQSDGLVIAGGNFTTADGSSLNRIARFHTDGTLDGGFLNGLSGADGSVNAVVSQTDDRIVVGGAFATIDGVGCQGIARLMTNGILDTSFNYGAGADSTVFALAESFIGGSRVIYAGGAFSTFNTIFSPGIVRLNNNGLVDSSFAVGGGANGTVYAVAAYPTNSVNNAGKVLVGGYFTNFNGVAVGNLVRLNADGSMDTNFDQNVSFGAAVRAIAIQLDDSALIGGDFTSVNTTAAGYIARINPDGTLDMSFIGAATPGLNGPVDAIALQADNRIMVSGQFSSDNGVTRGNITRLLPTGAVDSTINFGTGANGAINAIVVQPTDGNSVIGGDFTQYDGQPHDYIARIFGGSETGSGAFQFSSANYQIDENAHFATITIERTGGTSGTNSDGSGNVYVAFTTTTNGTAQAGVNYSYTTNTVVFPVGEVEETVYVPVLLDTTIKPNLTVPLVLTNPSPGTVLGDQPNAVLTIINDISEVVFDNPAPTVPKNTVSGLANIIIDRLGSTSGSCTVDFSTGTNGTAVIGQDYYPTNVVVTFNPGDTNESVQVPIIANTILGEGPTTVSMALTNAVNTLLGSPSNAVLTIQDTTKSPGNMFFTATNFAANASDGFAYLNVGRTNGTSGGISALYTIVPGGTAVAGLNYVAPAPGSKVSFSDGDTNEAIKIQLINSPVAQAAVTLFLQLSSPSPAGAGLVAPTNAVLTINNTNAVFAFVLGTNTAAENLGPATIVVQRFNNNNIISTVNYATTNATAIPGDSYSNAIAGINYVSTSGTLKFGVGESLKSISVPLINQSNTTTLAFGMTLSNPTNAALIPPTNTLVLIQGSAAGVSFTTNQTTVLKNAGSVLITVVCSNPGVEPTNSLTPLAVNFTTVDGTAKAGVNYNPTNGILMFTNGIGTNSFIVPVFNNPPFGNLAFSVILTNVTTPGYITPYGTDTVEMVESSPGLSFSQSDYSVLKNSGVATINVIRTGFTNSTVSVNYLATNGTAINGQNFVSTNGTLVFTNGVTSQSFNVALVANTLVQPNLFALLQLSDPTNAQIVEPSSATLTILETGGSYVIPAGSLLVTNSSFADLNLGIIGSNDTVKVMFAFRDAAGQSVTNLLAYLLATNGVSAPSPAFQSYGPLTVYGHSVSKPFSFTARGTNSYLISPTFMLYDSSTSTLIGSAVFNFTLGTWTTTFANTNMIIMFDNTQNTPVGTPASIYPSIIDVTNVGSSLIKATVTLTNISHASLSDVSALVVSPTTNTLIMAHVGGSGPMTHVTLTFDDAATNSLLQNVVPGTSTNRPSQIYPVVNFP